MFSKLDEEVIYWAGQGYAVISETTNDHQKTVFMQQGKPGHLCVLQSTIITDEERFHSVVLTVTELGFLKELP